MILLIDIFRFLIRANSFGKSSSFSPAPLRASVVHESLAVSVR